MAAASSLSFISPQTAAAAPRYNGTNCSMLAGRRYEIPYYNPILPVADIHAKGRRKRTTVKQQKATGAKSTQKTWQAEGITADIREPSKILAPKETVSSSIEQPGPSDNRVGSTLLEKTPSKDQHLRKDETNASVSDQENSISSVGGSTSEANVVVWNDSEGPYVARSTVDTGTEAGKPSEEDEETGEHDIWSVESSSLGKDETIATISDQEISSLAEGNDFEGPYVARSTVEIGTADGKPSEEDEETGKHDIWSVESSSLGKDETIATIYDQEISSLAEGNDFEGPYVARSTVEIGTEAGKPSVEDEETAKHDIWSAESSSLGKDETIATITDQEISSLAEELISSEESRKVTSVVSSNVFAATDVPIKELPKEDQSPLQDNFQLKSAAEGIECKESERPPNLRENQQEEELRFSKVKALSEKTTHEGTKIFLYPEDPRAGAEVELFFNRSASTLSQESSLKVRGAYNDWRWVSFEMDLRMTTLPGDWWSCKLQVPKEAYKIDFVFHNGGSVYENNENKDFSVLVKDGMEKYDFEEFLIEEELKGLERIAAEKALEEKQIAEEQRLAEKGVAEKADRLEAMKRANEQRERISRVLQRAVKYVEGLWYFEPSEFQGGETVKLFYNRANRNLAFSKEVWIHGGYNNWQDMVSMVGQLSSHSAEDSDWWTIDVAVPKQAFVLNWVLADGPPEAATTYDNNGYQDFHALVPKGVPNDLYWRDMEDRIFKTLQEEREEREEAARKKAERTTEIKAEFKEKTRSILVKSREHIFYTDPVDVQAGKEVTIFYNPSNTVLNGKPEVWLWACFNLWTHRRGPLPPVKMLPVLDTAFLKCTIKVPLDAYMMDFVFSERGKEGGGIFDNNLGKDYHVPVVGGSSREPAMKVVHISVEMAPVAKVGGLGDVVTSLSRAVQELGHSIEVILPKYDCLKYNYIYHLQEKEQFFWGGTRIKVWNGTVEGLPVIFLEPENGMVWAGCVYGRRDDGQRFGFFCHAALEYLLRSGRRPDIIHCHDWSSAPVAWLFKEQYKQSNLANARVVFTIHNLEYGTALIGRAMAYADKATTVSETYASEVSGNPAISAHRYKFCGIRNGIDLDIWDPYNDPFLPLPYTSNDVVEGKRAAKRELQSKLGLSQTDRPLVGIITRLTAQKGIHLIKHGILKTLDRGGQVVLLGSAPDPRIQGDFGNLANQLHNSRGDMARLCLHYDEPLSHLIYAGADFILIPSMFEPCGLTQLIAMRYGAIPVVRRTGGLNDTVFDVDHDRDRAAYNGLEPNGFSFDGTDAGGVDYALNRALSAWYEARDWFNGLCKEVMEQDWSWNRPAMDYIELYHNAKK